jgi:hypothetical protein
MPDLDALFAEADAHSDAGRHGEAFVLFRRAAHAGDVSSQLNLGYHYDVGFGTPRSRRWAMFWYRRAVRGGNSSAASNIGCLYRDEARPRLAERWFRTALAMGDEEANLELAKLYLGPLKDRMKARVALVRLGRAKVVTESGRQEAAALLKGLMRARRA